MCFEASQAVFWSLLWYKELKLITKALTGCTLPSRLIQIQNISLQSLGMHRKQKFEILDLILLSLLPSFFAFLASFFFSLAAHLAGFVLVGKVFRKAFRILGLDERKGRWVMEQDF